MEDKYRLELIGITYNQIESGVYALILQQVGTNRRIPIIIGFPEAQAIECKLQEIKTPRPLTHDVMMAALNQFNVKLEYVLIKRLNNGVFAADLHLSDGVNEKIVDSRSSDAVALAIRAGAPIFTTEDVIREASFDPAEKRRPGLPPKPSPNVAQVKVVKSGGLESMSVEQLHKAMDKAAQDEDYEEAARLKAEIDRRQNISSNG
ncbi:MAG: bifunctional nuclease family protein [Muribaculaceae bacterium]|nr:bifunctional nuclease family protein [Muribaculaceae bacterium]